MNVYSVSHTFDFDRALITKEKKRNCSIIIASIGIFIVVLLILGGIGINIFYFNISFRAVEFVASI